MHYIGRFAPSPTGPLHLGSLATALGSWLDARLHGGQWLLRIEDTDTPRCIPGAADDIIRTLTIFGLHWDGDISWQSRRGDVYSAALETLEAAGHIFPCACSRKDIELAMGPVERHRSQQYPGTCRHGMPAGKTARALRFRTVDAITDSPVHARWHERGEGWVAENVAANHGDFVVHRADGLWAYQLAVVVDDLAQGITHVVRGADLKDSTGRQVALMNALMQSRADDPHNPSRQPLQASSQGSWLEQPDTAFSGPTASIKPVPVYWHLPLVLNDRGEKLSKQAGAIALDTARPVSELNAAWRVFGLPPIDADTPHHWLTAALPVWKQYRKAV